MVTRPCRAAVAAALLVSACGPTEDYATNPDSAASADDDASAERLAGKCSPTSDTNPCPTAARLRLELTTDMSEHVGLLNIATDAIVDGSPTGTILSQLDRNSLDLAAIIADVQGTAAAGEWLGIWRDRVDTLVEYTQARVAGNGDAAASKKAHLIALEDDYISFYDALDPDFDDPWVRDEIQRLDQMMLETIDMQVGGSSDQFANARLTSHVAARHGDSLSIEFDQQYPKRFAGDPNTRDHILRAYYARLWLEDAWLQSRVGETFADNEDYAPPKTGLDANVQTIGDVIGQFYDWDTRYDFIIPMRALQNAYIDYLTAKKAGNENGAANARDRMLVQEKAMVDNLVAANHFIDEAKFRQMLYNHFDNVVAIGNAQLAHSESQYALIVDDEQDMEEIGILLARAFTKAHRNFYTPPWPMTHVPEN